ncbi:MAG: DNA mismatch repair protein MutS [Deltaproteobacteria bacterium]|nr:MAG: DNA mismatch repair protein MutS [Deltaproteobacteria bacterium]
MNTTTRMTPMLQQYLEIKQQHENAILFYRMGDFYEMFFDDAEKAAKILGITLTSRNKKTDAVQVPMCGIPYHAAQTYLSKLIQAGHRVAICEQTEDPSQAKGIVKREVIRVVSPGVITDEQLLDDKSNNYICALHCKKGGAGLYGLAFLDISTGEFFTGEFGTKKSGEEGVLDQLTRLTPSELLLSEQLPKEQPQLVDNIGNLLPDLCITEQDDSHFNREESEEILLEHFRVLNLDGFGCGQFTSAVTAAGALLGYIQETQKTSVGHIRALRPINTDNILHIDESSRRNLELTRTIAGAQRQGSLLSVIDHTCTPMGARLLKQNLLFPLQDRQRIIDRLDGVTYFFKESIPRKTLRALLEKGYDLERLNSRMTLGSGNGRDMLAMKKSLAILPEIAAVLQNCNTKKLIALNTELDLLEDLHQLLDEAIHEEAPLTIREGGLIKTGFNKELDELHHVLRDSKQLILDLENQEREATGIAKLKVGFNKVFGYFIEVSKIHADKVPEHYIRKQTLVNAERFITPELKEFEQKILNAEERRTELEYQLFVKIRETVAAASSRILCTAHVLAQLDFLLGNAEMAHRYNYLRPEITEDETIEIVEGRHPVIERMLPTGKFVPNDLFLDQKNDELLIITGPNMAGKSTILRQTALIVLLAQMGCYVPAQKASIGIVDRIFTRVGAMDNLRQGQSTFMVEMSETANILNNSTQKSLVILDEIGRGTSTYDGLSIAWAVAESLANKNGKGVKTLFATHYHELTELARKNKRVRNYSVGVREWKSNIIFLHKLVRGGTSRSYGIQVAALAGVPEEVVLRAQEILHKIEQGSFSGSFISDRKHLDGDKKTNPNQLQLFPPSTDPVREKLATITPETCTPLEAINLLHALKQLSEG